MNLLKQLISEIRRDHRELKSAAIALEQMRTRQDVRRAHEFEVSKKYARCVVLSNEFLTGNIVMAIIFAVVRPFGADDMDYKLMISAMWLLVSAAHFVLIFSTLKWLVYFVMFRVGVAAYVLATVLIYTITACLCVILAMSALPIEIHLRYFEMVLVFLLVIAFIAGVSVTSYLVMRHPILVGSTGEERLLALLPAELRGEILCLSADDHYVHVVTEKGRDLVRIKFQRAVELMDEAGGCLIHRSHWVSVKAVVSIESRSNGALFAHLKNGDKLPVSKGRAREFKTLVGPLL